MFRVFVSILLLGAFLSGSVTLPTFAFQAAATGVFVAYFALRSSGSVPVDSNHLNAVLPAALIFGVVVVWVFVQSLPILPQSWMETFRHHGALVLDSRSPSSISIDPEATRRGLLRFLVFAGIFFIAFTACRDMRNSRSLLWIVAVGGVVFAIYGLVTYVSDDRLTLWFDRSSSHGGISSTFVNRNHYATFAGLTLLCLTALLWRTVDRQGLTFGNWRLNVVLILDVAFLRIVFLVSSWLVVFLSILLSQSRSGLIVSVLGVGVLLLSVSIRRRMPWRRLALYSAFFLAVLVVLYGVGGVEVDHRFAVVDSSFGRLDIYRSVVDAIWAKPWTGYGLGSFREFIELHRSPDLVGFFLYAHNTYLEIAAEIGVMAGGMLLVAVLWLVGLTLAGIRRRQRRIHLPAVGLAASVVVLLHSLIDFPLQIPAVAATYYLILGMACAQSVGSTGVADRKFARVRKPRTKMAATH